MTKTKSNTKKVAKVLKALLIKPDGSETQVAPDNGKTFELEQLYSILECEMVELVVLADGRHMVLDEDGKRTPKQGNAKATVLLHQAGGMPHDVVVGNVLICKSKNGNWVGYL